MVKTLTTMSAKAAWALLPVHEWSTCEQAVQNAAQAPLYTTANTAQCHIIISQSQLQHTAAALRTISRRQLNDAIVSDISCM
jgi:hypothetical protein